MAAQSGGANLTMDGADGNSGQGSIELKVLTAESSDAVPLLEAVDGKLHSGKVPEESGEANLALDESDPLLKARKDKLEKDPAEVNVVTTEQPVLPLEEVDGKVHSGKIAAESLEANVSLGESDPLLKAPRDKSILGKDQVEVNVMTAEQPNGATLDMKEADENLEDSIDVQVVATGHPGGARRKMRGADDLERDAIELEVM